MNLMEQLKILSYYPENLIITLLIKNLTLLVMIMIIKI